MTFVYSCRMRVLLVALLAAESAWARRFLQALQPHGAGGVYVNFLDSDDDSSRVRAAYGDQTYRRLAEVKAKYDPDNAFHHNKNIQPGWRQRRPIGGGRTVGDDTTVQSAPA